MAPVRTNVHSSLYCELICPPPPLLDYELPKGNTPSIFLFFWLRPWHVEIPGPAIKPAPEPLQWQPAAPQENSLPIFSNFVKCWHSGKGSYW